MRLALALILALAAASQAAAQTQAPKDMVVLTVGGLVGKSNRGPFDAKRDSLLNEIGVDFKQAFAFDRDTLLGLPQGTVTVQPPEFDKPAVFSGPLLREVLGYIEAARVKTTFVAADGYTGWLMPEDIARSDWILALSADGVPLGLGQQGPLWLLNTRADEEAASDDRRGHWVWALIYIHLGE